MLDFSDNVVVKGKKNKNVYKNSLLNFGNGFLLFIGTGIVLFLAFFAFKNAHTGVVVLQSWINALFGVRMILSLISLFGGSNQNNKIYIVQFFINLAVFVLTLNHSFINLSLLISIVLFLDGGIRLLTSYLYKKAYLKNWWQSAVLGLISIGIGIALLFTKTLSVATLIKFIVIYIVVVSIWEIIAYLFQGKSWKEVSNNWKFDFLILHDNLVKNSFIPSNVFESFKAEIAENSETSQLLEQAIVSKDIPVVDNEYLTILIHSWNESRTTMKGHVDIIIDDTAYTFGNYDTYSQKFGGAYSKGTLMVMDKKRYIDYCLNTEGKVLIAYTIKVTPEQYQGAKDFVAEAISNTHPWVPDPKDTGFSAARTVRDQVGADIYIFDRTRFKYYLMIDTNCVRFVQELLHSIKFNESGISGIITPGDYARYFEAQVNNPKDTSVIKREVLMKETIPGTDEVIIAKDTVEKE